MKDFEILKIEEVRIIGRGILVNKEFLFEGSFYFKKKDEDYIKIVVLNLKKEFLLRHPYEVKLISLEDFRFLLRLIKRFKRLKRFKIKKTKN